MKNLNEIADNTKAKAEANNYETKKIEEELVRELQNQEDPDYKEFQRCKNKTVQKENKEKEKKAFNRLIAVICIAAV